MTALSSSLLVVLKYIEPAAHPTGYPALSVIRKSTGYPSDHTWYPAGYCVYQTFKRADYPAGRLSGVSPIS